MAAYGGKDLQKRKVLSLEWKSEGEMDDESGESMEPMEEVPLIGDWVSQKCRAIIINIIFKLTSTKPQAEKLG